MDWDVIEFRRAGPRSGLQIWQSDHQAELDF